MEERLRFISRLLDGEGMSAVCREFGISRKTGYKNQRDGREALCDRSRRPVRYANQLPEQVKRLIVATRKDKLHWVARKIREVLVRKPAGGGAEGILVTAVAGKSFSQGVGMLARGGTMSLVGLPPEDFLLSIFDTVLNGKTIRGSIVGTRLDLAESLQFAAEGKVKAHYKEETLADVNSIFDRMKAGTIEGRIVMAI